MRRVRIVVERYEGGYLAYPLGLKGAVFGAGGTYEEAMNDVRSALEFHLEVLGSDALGTDEIMESFMTELVL
jgi:predicted RNase H-like HicB family nuclease